MNLQRYPLYFGLAIVTYLMLLAWQDDNPSLLLNSQNSEPTAQSDQESPAGISEIPEIAAADVPTQLIASDEVPTLIQQTKEPEQRVDTERLINIATDTLNLQISLDGGDIVYLSLPKYLKDI